MRESNSVSAISNDLATHGGWCNDSEDVTPWESEDAAMADLHEFGLGAENLGIQLKKWPRGPVKSERY